jgi:hypothetical protein
MGVLDHKRGSLPRASSPQPAPPFPLGEAGGLSSFSPPLSAFENSSKTTEEMSEARPQESADARAGKAYYKDLHFLHYCHCGKWGSFGTGVSLKDERLGTWLCGEHKGGRA